MASITFSRKELEKSIGKLTKEMEEKIAMFGTPVDSLTNEEIVVEIMPNRPDLLSIRGFTRAFLHFLGKKQKTEYNAEKPGKNYKLIIEPSVKDIRPFTACCIVKNLKLTNEKIKEIIDIQEKLHLTLGRNRKKFAIGIYPMEKIKFPVYYLALESEKIKFVPLEMDKEMTGREVLQKHSVGREYSHLLEGKKKFPIFIDSNKNILSMPPIINSHLTGKITDKTKEVFVECSGFDFNILSKTLNILVSALTDMGGKIFSIEMHYGNKKIISPNLIEQKTQLSIENTNKLLGLQLKEAEIKNLLEKMGHNYVKGIVYSPAYRIDIMHEVDLIEDIAIAYSYDKFKAKLPEISTIGEENLTEIKKKKIAEILIGLGLLEVSSLHLTTKEILKKLGIKNFIEVEKSRTDYCVLRQSLLAQLLKILSENTTSEYPQKIFELGRVFEKKDNKTEEKEKLAIASCHEKANFTEIKQVFDYLMRMLNIDYKLEAEDKDEFIQGRCAKIIINSKPVGYIGEINPKILQNFGLSFPVALGEIEI